MAENETGQEKTEQATPKRLRESRDKGQIPRSRELNTMAVTLVGAASLFIMGEGMIGEMGGIFAHSFQPSREQIFDPATLLIFLKTALLDALLLIAPFLLVMFIVALFVPMLVGGWAFSAQAFAPKLERLNPIKGLKRIFALRGLMELFKTVAKFVLLAAVAWGMFLLMQREIFALGLEPLHQGLGHAGKMVGWTFVIMAAVLVVVAAMDVPFQLWDHAQKLKMTRQEVRDEMKETEGKPEVRQRVRQMQMEMSQRRMMEDVPKADVVITNPTHFAVALQYDPEKSGAPRVVALGADFVAAQIRKVAVHNQVEIVEAPPLARALYYNTRLGEEIPAELYLAVAQVLAYVFQLRQASEAGQDVPPAPNPDVPDEMWKPYHDEEKPE